MGFEDSNILLSDAFPSSRREGVFEVFPPLLLFVFFLLAFLIEYLVDSRVFEGGVIFEIGIRIVEHIF